MMDDKVRENRLRRMAERQGLKLAKSRRRDPKSADYGRYFLTGAATDYVDTGGGFDLDELELYLGGGPEIAIAPSDKLDFSFEDSGGKPILEFEGYDSTIKWRTQPHRRDEPAPVWRLTYLTAEGNVDDHRVVAMEKNPEWALEQARLHLLRIGYSPKASDR